jgi:hypothetical protein
MIAPLKSGSVFSRRMALVALVHPGEQAQVSVVRLVTKCALFRNKPALLGAPYRVESPVPAEVFRAFVSALEGGAVEITVANWARPPHRSLVKATQSCPIKPSISRTFQTLVSDEAFRLFFTKDVN